MMDGFTFKVYYRGLGAGYAGYEYKKGAYVVHGSIEKGKVDWHSLDYEHGKMHAHYSTRDEIPAKAQSVVDELFAMPNLDAIIKDGLLKAAMAEIRKFRWEVLDGIRNRYESDDDPEDDEYMPYWPQPSVLVVPAGYSSLLDWLTETLGTDESEGDDERP